MGGRLAQSDHSNDLKFPILIDGKSHLATLLIRQAHTETMHGGPQATLSHLRQRYWITGGKKVITKVTQSCITCRRFARRLASANPIMGDLPQERITQSRPFTHVGIDFGGPISLKTSSKSVRKAYIALLVCFTTKAVHIELVSSLSTPSCVSALKRFIARRGKPACIYSDNATNFIGARNAMIALREILGNDKKNSTASFIIQQGVDWVTVPLRARHFGGLWEAGIKSCKNHSRKVVGTQALTFEELYTVLTQIESIMNSRPLTPLSNDPNDVTALTPGHFLIGALLTALPDSVPNKETVSVTLKQRWLLTQQMVNDFWKRWSKEYLTTLNRRIKWKIQTRSLQVGDMVLVAEDNISPLQWPLARVMKTFLGNDDIARVVQIRTSKGTYNRPATKLHLLTSSCDK